ncbi:MAG: DinB family protein [Balneolaceae bacterium]|nr:DinB family protein [Balneolaceae bacterium]
MEENRIKSVLEMIDPPKGHRPWHGGPTVSGALRGVDHIAAAWKPFSDRHSIWELALHIAYWKYAVRRYLDPASKSGFPRVPSDWPRVSDPSAKAWKADKKLIANEHRTLIRSIREFSNERLDDKIRDDKEWTFIQLIMGIMAHDLYHIGQIQLMKRLYKSSIKNSQ